MSDPKQDMQSLEAEQAVLGAMLIDSDCIRDVLTRLRETDFVLMINGQIFRTIRELESGDKIIDAMVVANAMHADNELREYLAQLIEITPTSANVLEYADMVLSASRRRALRAAVQEAAEKLDANV
ncbi:MAG: replicative DNA helicase, partial [Clostridiales bacterium]|nr:replicative DNA helicase [Clostridiales bacterium]